MEFTGKFLRFLAVFALSIFLLPAAVQAQHYKQTNLVSDIMGMAPVHDPNLKNPWGLTRSSGSPWWIGNNNSGTSTLYDGNGNPFPPPQNGGPLVVTVPPPRFAPGTQSAPTGVVFNGSPTDFKAAHFIFATEDGTISSWASGQNAVLRVDNSDNGSANGAVYKGATSADINGQRFLYVTNFRSARVEVYDTNFTRAHLGEDAFEAEGIPSGFAPFNIQNIGGSLFVTYAKQNAARHDDVAGAGNGFVRIFTPSGRQIGSLEHGDWLNSPWGVVWTTRDFGEFSNAILVGNFGSGWIAAFNGFTYKFMGFVKAPKAPNAPDDSILTIDGLWSLTFANDGTAGLANTLYFTAGINGEQDGLFGTITPVDGLDGDEE